MVVYGLATIGAHNRGQHRVCSRLYIYFFFPLSFKNDQEALKRKRRGKWLAATILVLARMHKTAAEHSVGTYLGIWIGAASAVANRVANMLGAVFLDL